MARDLEKYAETRARWHKKYSKTCSFVVRRDGDDPVRDYLEYQQSTGHSPGAIIRQALREMMEEENGEK